MDNKIHTGTYKKKINISNNTNNNEIKIWCSHVGIVKFSSKVIKIIINTLRLNIVICTLLII